MLSSPVSRPPAIVRPASCGLILITGRGSSAIQRMWSMFMRAIGLTKCFLMSRISFSSLSKLRCAKVKCAVSIEPSSACTQLQSCHFFDDVAVRGRHQRHLQRRQFGHCAGRAHIGPDHLAPFAHRIGLDADQVLGVEIGIGGRHVDAAAVGVEFPAVIDAADAAFLVAAEPEIGAAVRAMLIDDADHAARVAEGQQLLAHDDDLLRRAVGFRQFLRQQHRQPEPAQQFAHRRARAAFGQESDCLLRGAWVSSGVLFAFDQAWRRRRGASTFGSRLMSRTVPAQTATTGRALPRRRQKLRISVQ